MPKVIIELEIDLDKIRSSQVNGEMLADFVLTCKAVAQVTPIFSAGKFTVPCVCGSPDCVVKEGTIIGFDKKVETCHRN